MNGIITNRMRNVVLLTLAGAVLLTACGHGAASEGGPGPAAATSPSSGSSTVSSSTVSSSPTTSATAAPTTSATSAAPSATTAGAAVALSTVAAVPAPTLPAVALSSPANYGTGLKARIVSMKRGKVTDTGPGLLTGRPALTLTLSLSNGSRHAVDLNRVQVTTSFGAAEAPGTPTNPTTTRPVKGTLKPGATTNGTYAFTLPNPADRQLRVTVWYAQGKPTVAFSGDFR